MLRSGWASLVLLNDTQAEAATNIHAKMIEGAAWLGRSTCTIGDVLGATIVGGKRLEVRQTQEVDMGVQTLASMPATLDELQNHNPTFEVPENDLAHGVLHVDVPTTGAQWLRNTRCASRKLRCG